VCPGARTIRPELRSRACFIVSWDGRARSHRSGKPPVDELIEDLGLDVQSLGEIVAYAALDTAPGECVEDDRW
jgi:hypothetical protein